MGNRKNSLETAKKLIASQESSEYNISSPSWMNPILYYSSAQDRPNFEIGNTKYFSKTIPIPAEEIANNILSSSKGLISSINSISDEMEREHKIDEYYRLIREIDMYEDFLCKKGKLKEAYANINLSFIPIIELTDAEKSMLIGSIFFSKSNDCDFDTQNDFYKKIIRLTQHHKINPLIILADIIKGSTLYFSYSDNYLSQLIKNFEMIPLQKSSEGLGELKEKAKMKLFKIDSYGFLDILYPYEDSPYYDHYEVMLSTKFYTRNKPLKKPSNIKKFHGKEFLEIPIDSNYFLSSPNKDTLAFNFPLDFSDFSANNYLGGFSIRVKHESSLISAIAIIKAMCEYYEQKDLSSYIVADKFNHLSITIDKINQDIVLSNLRNLHLALRTEVRRCKFLEQ